MPARKSTSATGSASGPEKTPDQPRRRRSAQPIFVIHKHDATTLHYDLRLEIGGVLKSWAVPKGPSTNPNDKRLAIEVDDHGLGYADFEGVIAGGHYGAGTVIVWDMGTVRALSTEESGAPSLERQLQEGRVAVWLEGKKLRGGWSLRLFRRERTRNMWLLVKLWDEGADLRHDLVVERPESVLSGKTNTDLKTEGTS